MDHYKNWSIRVRLEILMNKVGLQTEIRLQEQEKKIWHATYLNDHSAFSFEIEMINFVNH